MSRPALASDVAATSVPSSSTHHKRRRRLHSSVAASQPSVPSSQSSSPAASFVTLSTSSGRTITLHPHSRDASIIGNNMPSARTGRNTSFTANLSSTSTPASSPAVLSLNGSASSVVASVAMESSAPLSDVPAPVTLALPAPLPSVVVLPVTSPRLATALPELLSSASTALCLLPFLTRAPTQKHVLHSLLLSSPSQSLLLTFSSLAPTSSLPPPLVGLLTAAPVPVLLPTQLSKRQLKAALAAWQRPPNFTLSNTIACLTPLLLDLLTLSPSTAPSIQPSSVSWSDEWTFAPPNGSVAGQLQRLTAPAEYAVHMLRLYETAHAISTEFTSFAQEQLRQVHAFNFRFVPLLPVSPYRFTLDPHVEATFPVMRLPTNHRHYITTSHGDAERAIAHLMTSLPAQQPMIGFDTESRPMFVAGQPNRPISLVQLSSLSVSVLLRVRRESGLPPALVRLLVDPEVRKVGQGIGGDMRLLHSQYSGTHTSADAALPETLLSSPSSHSLIDLESLSSSYSIHKVGLASLTAAFLSLRLSKAAQLSNWERHTLTEEQISYAALDSLVSLKLAQRLQRVRDDLQAVVRGWVERERGRGRGVDGVEGVVDEAKVWRWLTGKGLNGLVQAKEESGEVDTSRKQQTTEHGQKQTTPRAPSVRPHQESRERQGEQKVRDKRQKVVQLTSRSSPSPAHNEAKQQRKPRQWVVRRDAQALNSNSGGSMPPIVAAQ